MEYALFITALAASLLTFFSGFGLGTLLMPVMLLWFPPPLAIALTGLVHALNSLFKVSLTFRSINYGVLKRFGVTAVVASFIGSYLLLQLGKLPVWFEYEFSGVHAEIGPLKMLVATLMMVFVFLEAMPAVKRWAFPEQWMPLGGIVSGFFGGLTGNQGALRSAFLIRAGMSKESFVATSAMIALLIDATRLGNYSQGVFSRYSNDLSTPVLFALSGALIGTLIGNRLLAKVTLEFVQKTVMAFLLVVAVMLAAGIL